jgi:anaerobic dimethyl sulfoxide reductase subunit B
MTADATTNPIANLQSPKPGVRYGFYLNLQSCVGCKACQIACKDKNNLDVGILWRKVVEVSGGDWVPNGPIWLDNTFAYFVSMACNHCEEPICMEVCPTKAITQREDGLVLLDGNLCVGCRYCEWACPYGAPQFDETVGVMTKCNFCYDNIDAGKAPACVSACQMRVLEFGDINDLRARHGDLDAVFPLPDAALTEPSIVFTPHPDTVQATYQTAGIGNREEL